MQRWKRLINHESDEMERFSATPKIVIANRLLGKPGNSNLESVAQCHFPGSKSRQ